MEEKRKYPRFDSEASINFIPIDSNLDPTQGFVKDISAEGFCFSSAQQLEEGVILSVEIKERKVDAPPLAVKVQVAWSKENPDQKKNNTTLSFITGVRVLGIRSDDEARFAMLYCERVLEELKKSYQG